MTDISGKVINSILNLKDNFSPTLKKVASNTNKFSSQLRSAETRANKLTESVSKFIKVSGGIAAAAAGMFVGSSIKTFESFEQAMANTAGLSGITKMSESYAKMEKAARDAGRATTKTAEESANALGYMALAGWSVDDSIKGLMPILRLSEATQSDLATTSDLVTDSMSALGINVDQLGHYLDVATMANNKSNQTATQLMEAYVGVGGTFKRLGTPIEESSSLLGVLANRGIKGSEAGNSLSSVMINLTKKSGESAEALEALGLNAYDSEGKFKGVTNVLNELNEKTKNLTAEQRDNYLTMIGGKTQIATLDALMSGLNTTNADGISELEALQTQLKNSDGALDQMADTVNNTMHGAFARMGSAIDDLKIEIGKKLAPYITPFINMLAEKLPIATEKFGNTINNIMPQVEKWFKKASNVFFELNEHSDILIPILGGIAGAFASFIVITKVTGFITKLIKTGGSLIKIFKLLNLTMLANPFTWIAIAIGALTGMFIYAYRKSETFREFVQKLWDKLKEFGSGLKTSVIAKLQELGKWFNEEMCPKIDKLKEAFMNLWNNVLKPLAEWLQPMFAAQFQTTFTFISDTINNVIETIKGIISGLTTALTGIIEFLTGVFTGDWELAWTGIKDVFSGIFEGVKSIFKGVINFIIDKLNFFYDTFNNIRDKVSSIPGFNWIGKIEFPKIPQFANGTSYFSGGAAIVGERGPELVTLPNGSKVNNNDKTKDILSQNSPTINIYIQGSSKSTDEILNDMVPKIKRALANI